MIYTTSIVRGYLCNFQRRAQNARPRPPDVLAVRVPPLEEAPYAASSCVWADIERAMKALPFNWEKITFAVLCLGGSEKEGTSWRNGMSVYNWREKVGDFWGITGGDVNRITKDAIQEMTDSLNGVAVTNG